MKIKYLVFLLILLLYTNSSSLIAEAQGSVKLQEIVQPDPLSVLLEKIPQDSEIDARAAVVVTELGGGVFNEELQAIVPVFPQRIQEDWKKYKDSISKTIGSVDPDIEDSEESLSWENSSRTVDDLLKDATQVAPSFKKACQKIALITDSRINFGPGDKNIIKTRDSLMSKVLEDSKQLGISPEQATAKIGDALRGTLITDRAEQIPYIIEEIKEFVARSGGAVLFKNLWKQERETGYVAIHAKVYIPFKNKKKVRYIMIELQVHLEAVMDGTIKCAKERAHQLYDNIDSGKFDTQILSSGSQLFYLAALRKYFEQTDNE